MVRILAINFKAYGTSYGEKALSIARAADEVAHKLKDQGIEIILIPPATELRTVSSVVSEAKVYAQHVDAVDDGARTGHITIGMVASTGAEGVMINHSEKRIRIDEIEWIINRAKDLGLKTLVCANTPKVAAAIAALSPDMIAVEPPELIGTGISVSKAKPEVIVNTVQAVRRISSEVIILTGAGITNDDDVRAAVKLGTQGVLVASAVMKSKAPRNKILELAKALL